MTIESAARICRLMALLVASPAGSVPARVWARPAAGICRDRPWSDTRRSACVQTDWTDRHQPRGPSARSSTLRSWEPARLPTALWHSAQTRIAVALWRWTHFLGGSTCDVSSRLMDSGEPPARRMRVSWQALGCSECLRLRSPWTTRDGFIRSAEELWRLG
jgi:hypothetical protein